MSDKVGDVTDDSFARDVLQASGPMLVHFWAEWAGPCKMMMPILDEVAVEYAGRLSIVGLNIDQNPETGPKYDLNGIPTLLMFNNGQDGARKTGALSKGQLTEFLDANL
ncbi:MAG: thioredoxin TrxA [Actinophytocola sp.]|uniref:thioredoxin TrxA n=1 Tax=Actinophytocola sp. TaxID=1872138 RepID=UPI003C70C9CD